MQPLLKSVADSGQLAKMAGTFIPTIQAANKVTMEPEIRKSAKRVKVRLGPISLAGKDQPKPMPILSPGSFISLDPHGQSFVNLVDASSICKSCTVLAGRPGLEFEDGSPAHAASKVYSHHILMGDIGRSGYLTVLPCDFPEFNLTATPIDSAIPLRPFFGKGIVSV
jgi:hypothetical protein